MDSALISLRVRCGEAIKSKAEVLFEVSVILQGYVARCYRLRCGASFYSVLHGAAVFVLKPLPPVDCRHLLFAPDDVLNVVKDGPNLTL